MNGGSAGRNYQDRLLLVGIEPVRDFQARTRPSPFDGNPREHSLINGLMGVIGDDYLAARPWPDSYLIGLSAAFRSLSFLFGVLASIALVRDLLPTDKASNNSCE